MRLLFLGTPDFAVPCLTALHEAGHEIVAVYTQPDKPKGRGYTMTPPPVKVEAERLGIDVLQPNSVKSEDACAQFASFNADVAVVVAYGKILPKAILDAPKYGCINVHASLLPKYRGAAPIQWSIVNGEEKTGVTTMQMDIGVDTGDMLLWDETPIAPNETGGELHDRLSQMGARLIVRTLEELEAGRLQPIKQDDSLSCHAPMLDRSVGVLDFSQSAQQVHDRIRGLSPWPCASATNGGRRFKILGSLMSDVHTEEECGTIISTSPLLVACADGTVIEITQLQEEGGKRMSAADYLRGHSFACGKFE